MKPTKSPERTALFGPIRIKSGRIRRIEERQQALDLAYNGIKPPKKQLKLPFEKG